MSYYEVDIDDRKLDQFHSEMINIAKTQYALEMNVSVYEVEEKFLETFETDASDFANFGQVQRQLYDSSDIDENDKIVEIQNLLVEPEEDDIELLERFFLRTKNGSSRYSQLKIWANFLKIIEINAPELYKVLEFMLIIPNGTAEVERFFKVLKDMKSKKKQIVCQQAN